MEDEKISRPATDTRPKLLDAYESINRMVADCRDAILVLDSLQTVRFANDAADHLFAGRASVGLEFGIPIGDVAPVELDVPRPDGRPRTVEMQISDTIWYGQNAKVIVFRDVTERNATTAELERLNGDLKRQATELRLALDEVKTLRGLLPICMHCKRIRDGREFWQSVEEYVTARTDATFTHSLCPECLEKFYPEDD